MKSFIFTFAMVSCFLLSQGQSLESRTTTTTTTLTTQATTTASENSSAASVPAPAVDVLHPFAKAVPVPTITTTKAPGQQCKEIGSPCSISDDCCSRKCVSYRSRCAY